MNSRPSSASTKTGSIYVLGTMDTKGAELTYVATCIRDAGARATLVDLGTGRTTATAADISRDIVAAHHPAGSTTVLTQGDRGRAISAMAEALLLFLLREFTEGKVTGVIGLGGTGGTALVSPAFRALPIGVPKVLVSTIGSGNTQPYVGISDFTMINSVVDVAGLNRVSRQVLGNAAHAIAGMVLHRLPSGAEKPTAGMTMFGVTTPCVNLVRGSLEQAGWDCLVFHATGTGGQAMEKLAEGGLIQGLLDLTTTEVADEVVGGIFRAGNRRFDVLAQRALPCVMSLGALDMVNFGAKETVPTRFQDRKLHVHNDQITLMRTTPDENRAFARWMAPKLNRAIGPLILLIPTKGVSALDASGQAFYDPEADAVLFDEIEKLFIATTTHQLFRLPYHINDPGFANEAVRYFQTLINP
jgi:uncharacterized protein (UPF0261 family)